MEYRYFTDAFEPDEPGLAFIDEHWFNLECDACGGVVLFKGSLPTFGGAVYQCLDCDYDEWFLEGGE
jgi:hypothetical protein